MASSLFPDTEVSLTEGIIEESGTSVVEGMESKGPQRWVKVGGRTFARVEDGLYHARWNDKVCIAHDGTGKVIGYWNATAGSGSTASRSSVIGAIALMLLLTAFFYLSGTWNFIWKSDLYKDRWWLTIITIFLYALYAIVWTPMYAWYEWQREKKAHALLASWRDAQ